MGRFQRDEPARGPSAAMDYSHAGGRQCRVPGAGERGFFGGEGRVEMGTAEESEGLGVEFEGLDGACGA